MERKVIIDTIIISGIGIVAVLLIWGLFVAKTEGFACQISPLQYAAKKIGEANNAPFVGSGYLLKDNSPILHFSAENVSIEYSLQDQGLSPTSHFSFNLSGLDASATVKKE